MTNSTLPNSTVINIFLSDKKENQRLAKSLIEEFLGTKIFEELTFNDLATFGLGSKYPMNYARVRNFVKTLNKDLSVENRDLVSAGLALVYDEGKELKEKCDKIHLSYKTGGAYLFSLKLLGLFLLSKNEEFRKFLRTKTDEEGEKFYVPHNLSRKRTRIGKYAATTKMPKKKEEVVEVQ